MEPSLPRPSFVDSVAVGRRVLGFDPACYRLPVNSPPTHDQQQTSPALVRSSFVVDPECPRRMARSAALGTERIFLGLMIAVLPAILLSVATRHLWYSPDSSAMSVVAGVVLALAVLVVLTLVVTAVTAFVTTGVMTQVNTAAMPPGSELTVEYYADRMVVTSAGGITRTTPYSTIGGIRVRGHVVQLRRTAGGALPFGGSAVLPIEVVPVAAQRVLREHLAR